LREGLDLPEVSLVAILDGDKEGFLRSARSLIQTFGRAARNANGRVVVYADKMTGSLKTAIDETNRRRQLQIEYNKKFGITPQTIIKNIPEALYQTVKGDYVEPEDVLGRASGIAKGINVKDIPRLIKNLEKEMHAAATDYKFEEAARLRDEIKKLKEVWLTIGEAPYGQSTFN
jgi:excinuclease ABC subunit B